MTMTISRAAMDALQKTLDEGTSIQKIWSILDSCTVVEPGSVADAPVAEVVQREPYLDGSPNPGCSLKWNHDICPSCEDSLPVGTKLYSAPPAASAEAQTAAGIDGLEKCGVCGHSAEVTYGRDIRFADDNRLMWRAECGGDDLCSAPTFTRFTREKAVESWNTHMRQDAALSAQPARTPALREVTDAPIAVIQRRECYSSIIKTLARLAQIPDDDKGMISRERAMLEVVRIREAIDKMNEAERAALESFRARLSTAQPEPFLQNAPDTDDIEQASAWVSSNCFDPEIEQTLHHALNRAQSPEAP